MDPKTRETLAENPFSMSLEEAFGASGLFGLSENCIGSEFILEVAAGENGRKVGVNDDENVSVNNVSVGSGVVEDGNEVEAVEGENVDVAVDKMAGSGENCADIDGTQIGTLAENGVHGETQMQECVTEAPFDGTSLLVNHDNGEKRREGAESVQEIEIGMFGNMSEEFGVEKPVDDDGMDEDKSVQSNETDGTQIGTLAENGVHRETRMLECVTEAPFDGTSLLVNHDNGEKRREGAESVQKIEMGMFGNMSEEIGIEKTVDDDGMDEDKSVQSNETDGTQIGTLAENGHRETQMQECVTEAPFDGTSLLVNHDNGEKRREGAESVQEIEMGVFGNMSEEFGIEKTVDDDGMDEDKSMQSNETDSPANVDVRDDGISLVVEVCCPPTGNMSEELGVEKTVEDDGMEEDNSMQSYKPDSAANVDVRDDGIALVVEVCCPPAGVIQGDLDEANCLESTASMGSLVVPDYKNNDRIEEVEESAGQQKHEGAIDNFESIYSMGDLVWVTTKSESWWPGQVCDPLDAPKYAAKSHEKECLFVRYFGNGNFAWSCPSQVKHFHENFEHMSTQSNSKSFIVALEKAVGEFRRRLKSEMTCSCNLLGSLSSHVGQLSGNVQVHKGLSVSQHKSCKFSTSQFEPSGFLAYLKNLSQLGSRPSKLELIVVQSRLWAYYCSIGHSQKSLRQLRDVDGQRLDEEDSMSTYEKEKEDMVDVPGNYKNSIAEEGALLSALEVSIRKKQETEVQNGSDETGGLKLASPSKEGTDLSIFHTIAESKVSSEGNVAGRADGEAEKGSESRERKKSKYLSPPYTDLNWGRKGFTESEAEDSKISKVSCEQIAVEKCSGKKYQKKWSRKPVDASKYLEVINTSSANLLSELHMAALDCLYPNEHKCFESIEILFSMFRRSVYHDESNFGIFNKNIVGQTEILEPSGTDLYASRPYVVGNVDETGSSGLSSPKVIAEQKKRKKKGENTLSCPFVIDSQDTGSPGLDVKPQQKKGKKKEGTTPASLPTKETTPPIPELNGNGVMLSFASDNSQVMSHVSSEGKLEPKKRKRKKEGTRNNGSTTSAGFANLNGNNVKPISLVVDLHIAPQLNRDGIETATSVGLNTTAGLPDVNGSSMSQEEGLQGKETATSVSLRTNGLPDVNGSSVLQGKRLLSSKGKPEPKKRKKKDKATIDYQKSTFGIPDLNGNGAEPVLLGKDSPEVKPEKRRKSTSGTKDPNFKNSKVGTNREVSVTTLLLTFASGFPMPSKDILVTIFSRFESLRESETLVFKDSSSAHVVFATNSDAVEAVKYLETSNPFGPALVNYRFQHLSGSSGDKNLRIPPIHPVEGAKVSTPSNPQNTPVGDAPPLFLVRQNLEVMTSMLEKSGNNLSADMKAKLEADIKSLLKKVSTIAGCSFSS